MSLSKKHVSGFSPNDGKLFALVDEQGVLRIWDTESNSLKQEFTPNLQQSGYCTALTWISVAPTRSSKSRKSQTAQNETLYLALGTFKGNVCLYSLAEGKIERTLKGQSHDGAITSIVYDNKGQLYTAGTDCQVIVWSLAEERNTGAWSVGPEKPQQIVYLPISKTLAVGSRQLKVYDIDTKQLLETFTGHTTEIYAMSSFSTSSGVEFAITTSKMERVICLWKVDKNGHNKASTCTLVMEDLAYCLACEMRSDGQLRVASVTRNGNIHIYVLDVNKLSAFIKPKVSLQIASDGADTVEPIHAIAAHFVNDASQSHEILFGYGSHRILQFEKFTPNYAEKLNVIVRTDPKKLYLKKKRNEKEATESALKIQPPVVSETTVEYNTALPVSKKKLKNQVPMEDRLQKLEVQASQQGDGQLQTKSKTQLLMQALHSKDKKLLRAVLNTQDMETVQLTLDRLPLEYVNPLVNELTNLMEGKQVSVTTSLRWLNVLSATHTSVMMTDDKEELRDKLGFCLGVAQQRMQCLADGLHISGRVNLIINQMKRNADNHLNEDQVLVFDESDDETPAVGEQQSENNWSDLEDDIADDNDLAVDVENPVMTSDAEDDGMDESHSDDSGTAGK